MKLYNVRNGCNLYLYIARYSRKLFNMSYVRICMHVKYMYAYTLYRIFIAIWPSCSALPFVYPHIYMQLLVNFDIDILIEA